MKVQMAKVLMLVSAWCAGIHGYSADTRGNGGDAVICEASAANTLAGAYVLDFLVSWNRHRHSYRDDMTADGLQVLRLLEEKSPFLANSLRSSLEDANAQILGTPDFGRSGIWTAADLRDFDIDDAQLYEAIPTNCGRQSETGGRIALHQLVVRTDRPAATVFAYDATLFSQIKQKPLQSSLILTHEWLWGLVERADYLRDANRFLHSKEALTVSNFEFNERLRVYGVRSVSDTTWISDAMYRAVDRLGEEVPSLNRCQFDGDVDPQAVDWWLTHKDRFMDAFRIGRGLRFSSAADDPCLELKSSSIPTFFVYKCRETVRTLRDAKEVIIASILQKQVGDLGSVRLLTETFLNRSEERRCPGG